MPAPFLARRADLARRAESLAAAELERVGLRILERNWRRPEGELDLVAISDDGTCVFCEVRSRTGEESGDPLEAIGPRKQQQVIRTARLYLAEVPTPSGVTGYRFDVVAVTFYSDDRAPTLVHIPAAFETT